VELVLATGILLLLAGVIIWSFAGARRSRDLEEGALRLESGIRRAQAEAASTGRRFCLVIGTAENPFQVFWEPEPLTAPGEFLLYAASNWPEDLPTGLVAVTRLELTGPSVYRILGVSGTPFKLIGLEGEADTLLFNADGSGDSAVIELAALDGMDERRAILELDGRLGTLTSRVLTPTELDEYNETRVAEVPVE
jgi:type II secretory pathway pseudopilin PulG